MHTVKVDQALRHTDCALAGRDVLLTAAACAGLGIAVSGLTNVLICTLLQAASARTVCRMFCIILLISQVRFPSDVLSRDGAADGFSASL